MITEAQGSALDAWYKANEHAGAMGRLALAMLLSGVQLDSGKLKEQMQRALDFYSTPQIDKILNA